jgi:hypothetical protein
MIRICIRGIVLLALVVIQGCAIGYDTVLFATKSNMGVDVDTAPPNLEVAISRQEGVIEPAFEGGQTVPVMASFSSKTNAFTSFFWGVGSTFSTGEAAFTMSQLYDKPTESDSKNIVYNRVNLKNKPAPKLPLGIVPKYVDAENVRPVLFGTDTSFGLKVKWSGATAQYPSSVNIGFKRKEVAIAPIGVSDASNNTFNVDVPSLLATIDSNVAIDHAAELSYLQYFATGAAASNLARQYAVREAMLKRSDPGQKFKVYRETVAGQVMEINTVLKCYAAVKQSDLPEVWQDASNNNLFFDKESLPKLLAWHKEATEKPEVSEEDMRKAHKRYVTEISTSEGTDAERAKSIETHGKNVCALAKK